MKHPLFLTAAVLFASFSTPVMAVIHTLYSIDTTTNNLVKLDTAGNVTVVGPTGVVVTPDIDLGWANNTLYALESNAGGTQKLYPVNNNTGAFGSPVSLSIAGGGQTIFAAEGLAGVGNILYVSYNGQGGGFSSDTFGSMTPGGIITPIASVSFDMDGLDIDLNNVWACDGAPFATSFFSGPVMPSAFVGTSVHPLAQGSEDLVTVQSVNQVISLTVDGYIRTSDMSTGLLVSDQLINSASNLSGLARQIALLPEPSSLGVVAVSMLIRRRR